MPNYLDLLHMLRDVSPKEIDGILDAYRKSRLPHSEPSTLAIITLTVLTEEGRLLKERLDEKRADESYREVAKGYHNVFNLALALAANEREIGRKTEQLGYTTEELNKVLEILRSLEADIDLDPTGYSLVDFTHGFVTYRNSLPRIIDGADAAKSKYKEVYEAALKRLNSPNGKQN